MSQRPVKPDQSSAPGEIATSALRDTVFALSESIARLSTREQQLRMVVEGLVEQKAHLETECSWRSTNVQDLKKSLLMLTEQQSQLGSELEQLERMAAGARTEIAELGSRRTALVDEIAVLTAERDRLLDEHARLQGEVEQLQAEHEDLVASGRPGAPWVQPELPQWLAAPDKFNCRLPVIDRLAIEVMVHDDYRHLFTPALGRTRDEIVLTALRNHLPWGGGTTDAYELAMVVAKGMEENRNRVVPGKQSSPKAGKGKRSAAGRPSKYAESLSRRREDEEM